MFGNLCRLCLGTDQLVWVFDDKLNDNMVEIIKVTCGVEISKSDRITQMVCNTCCQITIKMYKFRTTSIKNDKDLKAKCADNSISQLAASGITVKKDDKPTASEAVAVPKSFPIKYKLAHPSVKEVVRQYPGIKLPQICLKQHVGAYITLLTDEVDDWFYEQNYTDKDIERIKREAYERANPDRQISPPGPKRLKRKEERKAEERKRSLTRSPVNISKRTRISAETAKLKILTSAENSIISDVEVTFPEKTANTDVLTNRVKFPLNTPSVKTVRDRRKSTYSVSSVNSDSTDTINSKGDLESKPGTTPKIASPTDSNAKSKAKNVSGKGKINILSVSTVNPKVISPLGVSDKLKKRTETVVVKPNLPSSESVPKPQTDSSKKGSLLKTKPNAPSSESVSKPDTNSSKKSPSLLKSLLHGDTPVMEEEITLKSILDNQGEMVKTGLDKTRDKVVETKQNSPSTAPAKNSSTNSETGANTASKTKQGGAIPNENRAKTDLRTGNLVIPEVDFELFTSRPLVGGDQGSKPASTEPETFVVTDSEDGEPDENGAKSGNSSDSDPIVVDSPTSSNFSSNFSEKTDKTTFTEALELTPRNSNMPDFSLLSLANKSHTLHTCKVCDSQHGSLKELKYHQRKTHTKCPFCRKRFRSLGHRDEHVRTSCRKAHTSSLKQAKLELVRVDEVEEIRKKYSSAFQNRQEEKEKDKTETVSIVPVITVENKVVECDPATAAAVTELEKFFTQSEEVPDDNFKNKQNTPEMLTEKQATEPPAEKEAPEADSNKTDNVICISDEESDLTEPAPSYSVTTKPKIKIVNSDILKNINIHDNDFNVLKRILSMAKFKTSLQKANFVSLKNSPILDGNSSRIKVFKNLRKHLQHYKIPIEVKFSSAVSVEYKPTKVTHPKRVTDLWYTMTPQELKPLSKPKPTEVSTPTINFVITNQSAPKQNPVSTPQFTQVTSTPVVLTGMSAKSLYVNTIPSSNVTTTHFNGTLTSLMNSRQTVITNTQYNQSPNVTTKSPTAPLILAGNQNVSNSGVNNNITNYVLVPTSMMTLPASQGPLPVIQSVSSALDSNEEQPSVSAVATLQSITNSLMPASTSALSICDPPSSVVENKPVESTHQPAIRVKNLKELS